jgi:eukaryotic-like serine/threonine-protein kinase
MPTVDPEPRSRVDQLFHEALRPGTPDLIGRTLLHYRIVEQLGQGGMGVVYRAEDTNLDRSVAIKVLPAGQTSDPEARRRFVHEARAASALNHPNIVTIYDLGNEGDMHFIAMEHVPGKTLAAVIGPEGLPIAAALDCAVQISGALAAAHSAGIIHRDLKPANVMISDQAAVKILDFGLARWAESTQADAAITRTAGLTTPGIIVGTAAYMSPEQAAGQPIDARTDVFSFGALLYEMLTGRRAFVGDSTASLLAAVLRDNPIPAQAIRKAIPADITHVLSRCLDKDRTRRYASAIELHREIVLCRERFSRRNTGFHALIRRPRFAVSAALLTLILMAAGTWYAVRASRAGSAKASLAESARLIESDELDRAFHLIRQASRYVPDDPELNRLRTQCAATANISTSPPGAEVSWKSYRDVESPWETLARSPVSGPLVPRGYLRWRIVKEGYEPRELAGFGSDAIKAALYRAPAASGTVQVPAGVFWSPTQQLPLDECWLDKYEVTNRQFKDFVDNGGYRDRKYWKHDFVDDGKRIPWERALSHFRDTTGRPGPATWELGTYREGQEDYPVCGVSWYEAAAYAEFAGKSLPTVYHWRHASPDWNFEMVTLSNFGGTGPARVGSYGGLGPYGNYDMAGNVKEWCWNGFGGSRYLLGGAWDEPKHSFGEPDAQPPFRRSVNYGFRCAKYLAPLSEALKGEYQYQLRDYATEKPVSEEVFGIYRNMFSYDSTELASAIEAVDEKARYWRREKVTFNASYPGERVIAVLFLPRNTAPPFQTVVYFGGSEIFLEKNTSDSITGSDLDFIMRSGRALMVPVYKWSYERGSGGRNPASKTSSRWRDFVINCYRDLARSLDYLQSRSDIDRSRLAYLGWSAGSALGPVFNAVEPRFRTAVYIVAGLPNEAYAPEVDPLNFAAHVHVPVLMLNGRYDYTLPFSTSQLPLLRLLGGDKKHVVFDTAHTVPRLPMIKETLDWLDHYLGSVRTQ